MTKAELRKYVPAYESLFEGWHKRSEEAFFRVSGPFAQQVWFENLRSGAYRPAMAVSILVITDGAILHQFLDVKYRQVLPREHERKLDGVRKAMQTEFRPSIAKPFDEEEAMQMFIEQATDRIRDASSLAALYAYAGCLPQALEMVSKVRRLAEAKDELFVWEPALVDQAVDLATAIKNGSQAAYLAEKMEKGIAWFFGK